MSLSTHVLDAAIGQPAAGVPVRLERRGDDGGWTELASGCTGPDGRLSGWLAEGEPAAGVCRLVFDTGAYFAARDVASLYPEVAITFEVGPADQHYHLPLLLSPFAYSTYRGS
ncbi:MAG: hydroxyisourate hydrolase [Streptosporangiaceae bacterium]